MKLEVIIPMLPQNAESEAKVGRVRKEGEQKMTVFEELKARGLLAQLTDEEEIKELIAYCSRIFHTGKGNHSSA